MIDFVVVIIIVVILRIELVSVSFRLALSTFIPKHLTTPALSPMATYYLYLLLILLLSGFPAVFRRNCLLPSSTFATVEAAEPSSPSADGLRREAAATDASLSLLDRVLAAMETGLEFMEREEAVLNLDAIIGSRIVEGIKAERWW